ncbi:MAG: FAD-dependent thymidylate synthase [Methanomicrobia archaeon]|nr:FAD-dependent thymidylate synthase [Methanomicrobia archaeon]
MKVHLVTYTKDPDRICAMAAYVSVSKRPLSEFSEDWTDEDTEKWIKIVIERGHTSVLEHASFTFSLEGVSRVCTHQLVRHRIASYTQQSLRRVKMDKESIEIPEAIKRSSLFDRVNETLNELYSVYDLLIEKKIPREDARFILPEGTKTNIIVTMNCRELYESFFPLRCCTKAQWEIREVAWKMLEICKEKAPLIFKDAGPRCKKLGYCPEGEPCEEFKKFVRR